MKTPREYAEALADDLDRLSRSGGIVDRDYLADAAAHAFKGLESDAAARVTLEMTALIFKAEQDERARLRRIWIDAWSGPKNIQADEVMHAALAPDPVQVRAPAPVLRCGGCGEYERDLDPGVPCSTYDTAGHNLIEVDSDGMALVGSPLAIVVEQCRAALRPLVAHLSAAELEEVARDVGLGGPTPETATDALERAARLFDAKALECEAGECVIADDRQEAKQARAVAARIRSLKVST